MLEAQACWEPVIPNTFPLAQISPNTSFCADCSLCLNCLVVLLVPAQTLLTLRSPFKLPWTGEVPVPPPPGLPQLLAQAFTILPCPSLPAGGLNHPVRCIGTGTICLSSLWSCPAYTDWGSANPSRMNERMKEYYLPSCTASDNPQAKFISQNMPKGSPGSPLLRGSHPEATAIRVHVRNQHQSTEAEKGFRDKSSSFR